MNTHKLLLPALVLVMLAGTAFAVYYFVDDEALETPETVNTTQKASVDDGQELPEKTEITPTAQSSQPENQEPEQTVVVPELELPEVTGIPVDTNRFKIEEVKAETYLVTLYAIINSPSQYAEYQAQLKEFKQEALQYMTDNNVDIEQATINYSPQEAADL